MYISQLGIRFWLHLIHIYKTLRVLWPLLVPFVEYLFQEVALHFHLPCLQPRLVYNPTFLIFGPASLVFSNSFRLEFAHTLVKEYQTLSCSIGVSSLSTTPSFSTWWNIIFDEFLNSCSPTTGKIIIYCIFIHIITHADFLIFFL